MKEATQLIHMTKHAIANWKHRKLSFKRHQHHDVVGSLLGVVATIGFSVFGAKDSQSIDSWKDMPAISAGSMTARHKVPNF